MGERKIKICCREGLHKFKKIQCMEDNPMVCRALTWSVVLVGRYDGYLCSETPYIRLILIGLASWMCLEFRACTVDSNQHRSIGSFFSTYRTKFDAKMTTNKTKLNGEYDYECIRNTLSTYPLLSQEAGVSNQSDMASSQKYSTCTNLFGSVNPNNSLAQMACKGQSSFRKPGGCVVYQDFPNNFKCTG